jgi:hypothetical protein
VRRNGCGATAFVQPTTRIAAVSRTTSFSSYATAGKRMHIVDSRQQNRSGTHIDPQKVLPSSENTSSELRYSATTEDAQANGAQDGESLQCWSYPFDQPTTTIARSSPLPQVPTRDQKINLVWRVRIKFWSKEFLSVPFI